MAGCPCCGLPQGHPRDADDQPDGPRWRWQLIGQLGGYAGDTGAQQRAMMLTGGAMSMIAAGGRQKSLSEWAESILRWFEGLRPGSQAGQGLRLRRVDGAVLPRLATSTPGSTSTVCRRTCATTGGRTPSARPARPRHISQVRSRSAPTRSNVAWQRLRAGSELTRTEFSLAGQMSGQYAQRESSNRWFNELMGSMQQTIIPALSKSVVLVGSSSSPTPSKTC